MRTLLLLGLAMLSGCSLVSEDWPPTLDEVQAKLGTPPRGQARVWIDHVNGGTYNGLVQHRMSYCSLVIELGMQESIWTGGGSLFYEDVCRRSIRQQLDVGSNWKIAGYTEGNDTQERYTIVNDSTISGVVVMTMRAQSAVWAGTLRLAMTFTTAGPRLPLSAPPY